MSNAGGYVWFSENEISEWPAHHKKCRTCLEVKPFTDFHKHKSALYGFNTVCKACRLPISKAHYATTSKGPRPSVPENVRMWRRAKFRASKKGLAFTIKPEDIVIPECCPALGCKLDDNNKASLDQIQPGQGYTKHNVAVISARANMLKNNATIEELEAIVAWMKSVNRVC